MSKGTYKTILWLYSNDKDSGSTNQDCSFILQKPIENVKSFKLKNFQVDITGLTVYAAKIGSKSLSSLTTDRIVTTSKTSDIVFDVDLNYGTINEINYNCQRGKIYKIDIKIYDQSGTTLIGLGSNVWAMALEFECVHY